MRRGITRLDIFPSCNNKTIECALNRASAAKRVHLVVRITTVPSLAPQFVELLQLQPLLLVIWRCEARITRLSLATMTNLLRMNSF